MIGLSHGQIITDLVLRLVVCIFLYLKVVGFNRAQRILSLDSHGIDSVQRLWNGILLRGTYSQK